MTTGCSATAAEMAAHGGGVVDPPDRVAHAVVVDDVGQRRVVDREQVGEALGERQAPDRREVGPARAEEVEPVALGLRGGVLVGEDVGAGRAELERADHAGGVPLDAGVVGGGHAVHGEASGARRRTRVPSASQAASRSRATA